MVGYRDGQRFAIQIIHFGPVDQIRANYDLFVHFEDGSRFVATFFTLANIEWLFEKDRITGESAGGVYSWSTDMILVRNYSDAVFEATVCDLLATGSFERAFARCEDDEDSDRSAWWVEAARSAPPVRVVWGLHPC